MALGAPLRASSAVKIIHKRGILSAFVGFVDKVITEIYISAFSNKQTTDLVLRLDVKIHHRSLILIHFDLFDIKLQFQ